LEKNEGLASHNDIVVESSYQVESEVK
jgi:hypothetical protein